MQVSVKILGHLDEYLPRDDAGDPILFDGTNFECPDGLSVEQLAEFIGLPAEASELFVMVNDEHVSDRKWAQYVLNASDKIVFCPPLKGG